MSDQNLASPERGEVLPSVEADGTALRAQSAHELATSAQARADQAYNQGVLAEQRADQAILDAANALAQANLALDTAATEEKVSAAGDTMTGYLTLHADPSLPLHASTKAYTDNAITAATANFLPASDVYTRAHIDQTFLPKSAPVVTGGPLTLAQDATADMHATTLQQVIALLSSFLTPGFIVMWAGTPESVPEGWAICDGTNGTPDLRGRFPIGAGSSYAVGSEGGSLTHNHHITVHGHQLSLAQIPQHNHPVSDGGHSHSMNSAGSHTHSQRVTGRGYFVSWDGSYRAVDSTSGGGGTRTVMNSAGNHTHHINTASSNISIGDRGGNQAHAHTATATMGNHLPPYRAIYFIMKL